MTTDPVQPETEGTVPPEAAMPAPEPVSAASLPEEPATPAESPAGESPVPDSPVAESPVAESSDASGAAQEEALADASSADASSAAARIREKMSVTSEKLAPISSNQGQTTSSRPGSVEIPGTDDLEETLEAEISAAMTVDIIVPPVVSAEAEEVAGEGPVKEIGPGAKVKGVVHAIHAGDVFLEAGLLHNVVLALTQFPEGKQPAIGDTLDVIIDAADADGLIRGRIPRARHKAGGNWDSLAVGQIVDCLVSAVNKGGLQVTVSNLRGFLPASQVELGFAGNLEGYVGQKLSVQITEVNAKKRNLVVSRRALLQAERAEGEGEFWSKVEVGQDFRGVVKTLKDYGAFVNIGVVDGFLHIGEISWSRINHPKDVLAEGQEIDVKILKLDPEKKRVSLGMKQLAQNPWASATEHYATGRTVSGKVTRITEFGAFVELEPGLEGMVHISELAWRRVGSVGEILKVGETRDFQVVEVDTKRKRVSLSLKALEKRPEPPRSERNEEPEQPAQAEAKRQRNPNLRGGTGSSSGRGLFGNPNDFT
jgi:predicted RNA-binding protein with RPS1 domain